MPATPRKPQPRATMKDVAMLAGVGIKTVSRVVNGEPNVSEAMAAKVWDAVRTLKYQVDLQAGSLRRADGRTRTIGLLVGSVDNPIAGAIHRAVEDAAAAHGVAVLAASMDDDPDREDQAVETFLQRRVDGLILTTAQAYPSYVETLAGRGIPAVFVDRDPLADIDCVTSDNRTGAAAATAHLIAHGHRNIALLADRLQIQSARMRYEGYFDALSAAGIAASVAPVASELSTSEPAREALAAMLAGPNPPTAVFSAQNLITIGALHALRDAQLQHRVALVSFDDLPLANLMTPGITVVQQHPQHIGQRAVDLLFERLAGEAGPAQKVEIPTTLIARGSGEISA